MKSLIFSLIVLTSDVVAGIDSPKIKEALGRLMEGNKRYVEQRFEHPNRTAETRAAAVSGQNPFAIILGCSDSRASPEILFDQGIGDLFVVRVAGNVAGDIETDSIDYSALVLGSNLIVVLGHENCGAVTAVVNKNTKDIPEIAKLMQPAIQSITNIEEAVKANVRAVVKQLKSSKLIARLIQEEKLDVVGGYYEFKSGKVEFLDLPNS